MRVMDIQEFEMDRKQARGCGGVGVMVNSIFSIFFVVRFSRSRDPLASSVSYNSSFSS